MKQQRRKVEKVRVGDVTVRIYRREKVVAGSTYTVHEVADYATGKRRLRSFSNHADARSEANRIAASMASGQATAASLAAGDAASYGRALELLKGTGVSLELACAAFAEALKILGGDHVVAAARLYAKRNPAALPDKSVPAVVTELLEHKKARGASARYLQDLRVRLTRFGNTFNVPISSVTSANVQSFLDGLHAAPQTVLNFRRVLNLLFTFAEARGLVHRGENPIAQVEKVSVRSTDAVEIFTPSEIAALLAGASEAFRPCMALGAFAGLRSAEVERLAWEDVDLRRGFITIGADRSKTGSRRLVPISPNLRAWLAEVENRKGPVWRGTHEEFYEEQQTAAERAGMAWKANGLRHSYASYRLAKVKSAAEVALELGNSPSVVFRHYRELVKPAEAARWFAVSPAKPANVSTIPNRRTA